MFVYRLLKTFGCCAKASANDEPPLMDCVILWTTFLSSGFSHWFSRMFKHCNIGSPAELIEENIRVKRAISAGLIPEPILILISVGFFLRLTIIKRRRINSASASALSFASIEPSKLLPWLVVALYRNSAIG